jgi:hypothetical protein
LNACVLQKQNRERASIVQALNRLGPSDPNSQYRSYVQARQTDRHQKIDAWRSQLNQDIASKRDVTIDQLEQDLEQVTSTVQSRL